MMKLAVHNTDSPISSIERPESGVGMTAPCGWAASQRVIASPRSAAGILSAP